MHPGVPRRSGRALRQWDTLHRTYLELGHRVDLLDPVAGLPDMVYAANGALPSSAGASCWAPGSATPSGEAEAAAPHATGSARAGVRPGAWSPEFVNEGRATCSSPATVVLAGSGFRTDPAGPRRGRPACSGAPSSRWSSSTRATTTSTPPSPSSTTTTIAWLPERSSPRRRRRCCASGFPGAVVADPLDAAVPRPQRGERRTARRACPHRPPGWPVRWPSADSSLVPVDLSELLKGGGGPKCCTLEVRLMTITRRMRPSTDMSLTRRPRAPRRGPLRAQLPPLPVVMAARARAPGSPTSRAAATSTASPATRAQLRPRPSRPAAPRPTARLDRVTLTSRAFGSDQLGPFCAGPRRCSAGRWCCR